jgi:hypothetical protein
MEVMHDGAAQMAEHEPEDGLEDFLGCRRHAGRVSEGKIESRKIVSRMGGAAILRHEEKKIQNPPSRGARKRLVFESGGTCPVMGLRQTEARNGTVSAQRL